jgi:hypothetical protein
MTINHPALGHENPILAHFENFIAIFTIFSCFIHPISSCPAPARLSHRAERKIVCADGQKTHKNCKKPHTFRQKSALYQSKLVPDTCYPAFLSSSEKAMQISRLIMRKSLTNISLTPHKGHSTTVENIRQITPIVQNKPKVKSPRIHLTAVITSTYTPMDNWLNAKNKPNQTQFKPNARNSYKPVYCRILYTKTAPPRAKKQTQNKPNRQTAPKHLPKCRLRRNDRCQANKNKPKQTHFTPSHPTTHHRDEILRPPRAIYTPDADYPCLFVFPLYNFPENNKSC